MRGMLVAVLCQSLRFPLAMHERAICAFVDLLPLVALYFQLSLLQDSRGKKGTR